MRFSFIHDFSTALLSFLVRIGESTDALIIRCTHRLGLHVQWRYYVLSMIAFVGIIVASEQFILGGVLAVIVCVLPLCLMLIIRYPRLWLNIVAMSTFYWFRDKSDDVTALEMLLVAFYLGTLGVWFAVQWFITRKQLIHNSADRAMALFGALLPLNLIVALLNDITVVEWLRTTLLLIFVMYYFPLREHLTTDRHIYWFVGSFAVSCLILGLFTVESYTKAATNAVYAYQLVASRVRNNEIVSVCASAFSAVAFLMIRRPLYRFVFLGATAFFIGVLVGSFSRGFWLGFLVGFGLLIWHLRPQERRMLVVSFGVSGVVLVITLFTMFGKAGELALRVIGTRFTSSGIGKKDLSLQSRINESVVVVDQILAHPLTGTGAGSRYHFFEPILRYTIDVTFIHNGYLFMLHKYGIPMTLLWYYAIGWYLWQAWKHLSRVQTPLYRLLLFGSFATLCASVIVNNTSAQYECRDGNFIVAFMLAFIGISLRHWQHHEFPKTAGIVPTDTRTSYHAHSVVHTNHTDYPRLPSSVSSSSISPPLLP
jgi:O-antigen ligase